MAKNTLILIIFFIVVEWLGRSEQYAIESCGMKWKKIYRWSFYFVIIALIFVFNGKEQQFIYFQF